MRVAGGKRVPRARVCTAPVTDHFGRDRGSGSGKRTLVAGLNGLGTTPTMANPSAVVALAAVTASMTTRNVSGSLLALLATLTKQLSLPPAVGVTHTRIGVLFPGATVCAVSVVSMLKGALPHPEMPSITRSSQPVFTT
jgi:hypothetical protein